MKPLPLPEIWVYLSASPLLGLTITLFAYQLAFWVFRRSTLGLFAELQAFAVMY